VGRAIDAIVGDGIGDQRIVRVHPDAPGDGALGDRVVVGRNEVPQSGGDVEGAVNVAAQVHGGIPIHVARADECGVANLVSAVGDRGHELAVQAGNRRAGDAADGGEVVGV